jgi:hypothetical protein
MTAAPSTAVKQHIYVLLVGLLLGIVLTLGVSRLLNPPIPPSLANDWGVFPVPPRTEWLPDGRKMRLLSDFYYIDPRHRAWIAPTGTEVDGASIPPLLWSVIGGPFEGQYRDASIVHDIECVRKTTPWEEVHYMFYEACRCGGVGERKAKLLYAGVYHGGPRWVSEVRMRTETVTGPNGEQETHEIPETVTASLAPQTTFDEGSLRKLEEFINSKNPSLDELKTLDPSAL